MLSRRDYLRLSSLAAGSALLPGSLRAQPPADYTLTIAPHTFEYKPNRFLKTIAYNQQVPGPLLRFSEGKPVTIDVINHSPNPEVVHWHGLFLPPEIDGAMEEGTPAIPPGASTRLTFTPTPGGLRWYHTHTFAGTDMKKGQYTALHGPLYIEPATGQTPPHDHEFFLTLHDYDGEFLPSGDGSLMPVYNVSTINGRSLGFGDPLRVSPGDRVLFHIINTSPTEVHWLALAGHQFTVLALDGNAVPTPRAVSQLRLAPAERISAVVEMNNPGLWVLGEIRRHIQAAGMGIVLEYANAKGMPQWRQPDALEWSYLSFSAPPVSTTPTQINGETINLSLSFTSRFRGHGAPEQWLINGKPFREADFLTLRKDRRYRLQLVNRSADDHPLHLHRHAFELRRIAGTDASGILKDVILVPANGTVEVEFTASHPGATLFHCHQQDHMDNGFMTLFRYA